MAVMTARAVIRLREVRKEASTASPKRFAPARIAAHVSLVDLLPTFMDLACDGQPPAPVGPLHGSSLLPLLTGADQGADRCVVSEYSSEGVCAASRMVRQGPWKYIFTHGLAPMLFNLATDPTEKFNLAGQEPERDPAQALAEDEPQDVAAEHLVAILVEQVRHVPA